MLHLPSKNRMQGLVQDGSAKGLHDATLEHACLPTTMGTTLSRMARMALTKLTPT